MSRLREAIRLAATGPARGAFPEAVERPYRFGPEFPGFDGHFPGYPVLPAVVQIQTALLLAEEQGGQELELLSVESAKFLQQLRPDEDIVVSCRPRMKGEKQAIDARLSRDGQPAASFLLLVAARSRC
jgi:3-hydroxyacyl-[acyl-carrier-protein] dehydratase